MVASNISGMESPEMTEKEKRNKISRIKRKLNERFFQMDLIKTRRREVQCFEYRVDRYFSIFIFHNLSRRHGSIKMDGSMEIYVDGFDEMISEEYSMPYFALANIGMMPQIFPRVWEDGCFYAEYTDSEDQIADDFVSVISKIALPALLPYCSFAGARQILEAVSHGEIIREVDVPDADVKLSFLESRQSDASFDLKLR
jgi:hypothetical protein